MKTWKIRSSRRSSAQKLADALQIPPALARILVSRGYGTAEEASAFLHASLEDLSRPFELPNLGAAVEKIGEAIAAKKRIAIYGDYDVDGICATSLMRQVFAWLGVEVMVRIPSRFREGYGMNAEALAALQSEGCELVITVDNGIASAELVEAFSAKGLDFIVTDHHQLPETLPACIVVNPLLGDNVTAAYHGLCGCGTAYFLAMGMLVRLAPALYDDAHRRALLDLVAVATIADIVPLLGDNRILVREGLAVLNSQPRPGMAALVKCLAKEGQGDFKASDVAFRIAPCINACGRLDRTADALALFAPTPAADIQTLAEDVVNYNEERKEIERAITKEATAQFADHHGKLHCAIAVGENWHPGVIGIVASRLVETFGCPAMVLTTTEANPDVYTGSARSVKGFHLYEGLRAVSEHLLKFGGHEMAAGLSVARDDLDAFKDAFSAVCAEQEEVLAETVLWIDDVIGVDEANAELEEALALLEPCGCENPEPLFAIEGQGRFAHRPVGADGAHLRLEFARKDGSTLSGIAFRKGDYDFLDNHRYDFAFHLSENCFRGNCDVQLLVQEIAPAWQAVETPLLRTLMDRGANYVRSAAKGICDQTCFHTKVRGVSFDNRQALIADLQPGAVLRLLRETQNPVDANAIACLSEADAQIGYLSRDIAAQLAPIMDLGAEFEAIVTDITGGGDKHLGVNLLVRNRSLIAAQEAAQSEKREMQALAEDELVALLTEALLDDGELLPLQQAAIDNIVQRHENTCVLMPTGRGKSLIYQMAAGIIARRDQRATIVISPLKALISDQYQFLQDRLAPLGFGVFKGNGDLSPAERQELLARIEQHQVDILLATPEFFVRHGDLFRREQDHIGQIVIDEAHYLTSKRAAYKKLRALAPAFSETVWTYLTATVPTAEADAFREIISGAGLYIDNHIRYNLHIIDARQTEKRLVYLYRLFMHPEKTICYVNSRKQAFALSQRLREVLPYQLRPLVGYYHGGLPQEGRRAIERAFKEGEIRLLFATTAFGEGIHIPDIRNVVLYHPCFSVEAFNQQAGRCARDGEDGRIHLLYSERDFALNEMIVGDRGPSRAQLGTMYQLIKRVGAAQDFHIQMASEDFFEALAKMNEDVTRRQWRLALTIFSELDFLQFNEENDTITINIEKNPSHRQLTESATFLEGASEARALETYEKVAFSNNVEALEALIRSALRPAEWRGREV
ncbi:MAG: single-stranded-DNA-specific exonuclease RecJ [Peptococcaceae bacterium]|nr:single-stranded-DNA-specific exonuclease RecJ [Peptococcaceae bacterium]